MDELDELRLRIAKAKGWEVRKDKFTGRFFLVEPDGDCHDWERDTELEVWLIALQKHPKPVYIPDHTRDIAAAWTLVEEMTKTFPFFAMDYDSRTSKYTMTLIEKWVDHNEWLAGEGDTAPEAICRAYLAWKEATK